MILDWVYSKPEARSKMSQKVRLDKLHLSLTPKQAAILWVQELTRFQNLNEYVEYLLKHSEGHTPLSSLPDQVEQAVRDEMKGRPKDEIWQHVRLAVRDVVFLYYLVLKVNERALGKEREWRLLVIALAEKLNGLIEEPFQVKRFKRKEHLNYWREFAEQSLIELYIYEEMVNSVREQYYDGLQTLFPDVEQTLKRVMGNIEEIVDTYKILFGRKVKGCESIVPERLRSIARREMASEKYTPVDEAKIEALIFIGERDSAVELIEREL